MSSISYIFGITASIIRNIRSLALFFDYYKIMKLSINPNFEIDDKLLASKNSIYKDIFYISMCFLYIYIMDIDEIILYYTSLSNLIIIIAVLNMLLFSIKRQNQMLLQTLLVFFLLQISFKFLNINIIGILLICSTLLKLIEPIKKFRIALIHDNKSLIDLCLAGYELVLYSSWLLYSLSYNIVYFTIAILIRTFLQVCFILGLLIIKGKISKNTLIYSFLIKIFFIDVHPQKYDSNILLYN